MAFQLQGWAPQGMGLTYNPMTMPTTPAAGTRPGFDINGRPLPGFDINGRPIPVDPKVVDPKADPRQFGMYRPGDKVPNRIGPNNDIYTALDKMMRFTGAVGTAKGGGPGQLIDPKKARAMGMLAQGNAVGGNKRTTNMNTDVLASILSLGAGGKKMK